MASPRGISLTEQDILDSGWRYRVTAPRAERGELTREIEEEFRRDAEARMPRAQKLVLVEVIRTLGRTRSEPARPGEPPRRVLGELQESWFAAAPFWRSEKGLLSYLGPLESRSRSAGPLEFGAPRLGIAAHPYYRPTLARIADRVEAILLGEGRG